MAEGEGGMNWEIRFDINTLPCVKQIPNGDLRCSTRELSSVICDDLDIWDWGWGGKNEVQKGGIYIYTYG